MSAYIISEKALEDINNIWIYTAENWSVEQAIRYYNLIIDEIEYIVANF
jgi:toxin ParE1/3/4